MSATLTALNLSVGGAALGFSGPEPASDQPIPLYARQPQVLAAIPISDATLWRWIKQKKFPAPVKLGPGVTAWRVSDVQAWAQGITNNSN